MLFCPTESNLDVSDKPRPATVVRRLQSIIGINVYTYIYMYVHTLQYVRAVLISTLILTESDSAVVEPCEPCVSKDEALQQEDISGI